MLARLTRSWVTVGTQSVGGGTSTLLLIRRLAVDRERWMSPREFGEAWALSQLSPGIHLVALAGLIGHRVAGWRGVAAAVAGMMIPAAAITVALTAAYAPVGTSPLAFGIITASGTPLPMAARISRDRDVLTYRGTLHPAAVIAIGAAAGLLLGR